MTYQLINGNNIDVLKTYPDNCFDSIVTDPPYGIDFLGKAWDANTGALETYQECLRVLKPGGHILAFSAARTYHHLAITLEQAGFEIRDQIMWLYASGFPKSQDVGRGIQRSLGVKETRKVKSTDGYNLNNQIGFTENNNVGHGEMKPITVCTDPEALQWQGWGTALKPAHEPICLARKPMKSSIAKNCQQWGTGALNIDASRVLYDNSDTVVPKEESGNELSSIGRFPSNVLGEVTGYQKFFYCPKVSRRERHVGHEMPAPMFGDVKGAYDENGARMAVGLNARAERISAEHTFDRKAQGPGGGSTSGNNHPTVKPVELMKYLIKLVTPPGGHVLDPFNGSGSTGMAAVELGYNYTGIDLDAKYIEISRRRIEGWTTTLPGDLFE